MWRKQDKKGIKNSSKMWVSSVVCWQTALRENKKKETKPWFLVCVHFKLSICWHWTRVCRKCQEPASGPAGSNTPQGETDPPGISSMCTASQFSHPDPRRQALKYQHQPVIHYGIPWEGTQLHRLPSAKGSTQERAWL